MDVVFPLTPPLRIRFQDAPPRAAQFFESEYGRMSAPPDGADPDLLVRFVDTLPRPETREYLGPDAELADGALIVIAGGARARIDLNDDGSIVADVEHKMPVDIVRRQVVIAAVALLALGRDAVVAHGSATYRDGQAVILFGDGGAGKTSVLAGLVAAGHNYVADDQLLLTRDGRLIPFQGLLELRLDTLENDARLGRLAVHTGWRQARVLRSLARAGMKVFSSLPTRIARRSAGVLGRVENGLSELCFFVDAREVFEKYESSALDIPLNVFFLTRGHPEAIHSVHPDRVGLWLRDEIGTANEPLVSRMARAGRNSTRWHELHVQVVARQERMIDALASLPGTYLRIAPGPSVDRAVELIDQMTSHPTE